MKTNYIVAIVLLGFMASSSIVSAHDGHNHNVKTNNTSKTIDFIENKGQWVNEVKFKAEVPGGSLFITNNGFVHNYASQSDLMRIHNLTCGENAQEGVDISKEIINCHAYKVNFVGGNAQNVYYKTQDIRSYYHNYFLSNNPKEWAGKVMLSGKIEQKNIYDGIDMIIYSENVHQIKYDIIIAPGANPNQVAFSFDGVSPILTKDGHLKIVTSVNEIIEKAPYSYQIINEQKVFVESKYKLSDGILTFEFPNSYNTQYPLIIDPDLVYATYSGGTGTNYAHLATFDKDGNTYAGGLSSGAASGWPTTTGAFQLTGPGNVTVINKYNPDGSDLIFSTYFGQAVTQPNAIRANEDNELVLAGATSDASLPTTTGAYQTTLSGAQDIYVAHFTEDGSGLIGCTFVGGSGFENSQIGQSGSYPGLGSSGAGAVNPTEIAFDASGNIWVTSNSSSNDFPVTANAAQSTFGGGTDAVVFKLNPDCSQLLYSTYIGGSDWDGGIGIELSENGDVVTVGMTRSNNFPTTASAFKTTHSGGDDGYAAIINTTSGNITACTYLGTANKDDAERVAFDCAGNIFVAGKSMGGTYPINGSVWSNANGSIYIQKLSPDLSTGTYSTRIGGAVERVPSAMIVDICGNILLSTIAGVENGLSLTDDAFQTTATPFWFVALAPNFGDIVFGSYFGQGSADHYHPGTARMDPEGIVYHSICNAQGGFPVTPGCWSFNKMNGSTNDVITFKFNFDAVAVKTSGESPEGGNDPNLHAVRGCKSAFIHFERASPDSTEAMVIKYQIEGDAINGTDYQWIPDSIIIWPLDTIATLEIKPLLVPQATGVRRVIINTLSPCNCDGDEEGNIIARDTVYIHDSLYVQIPIKTDTSCPNDEIIITADIDSTLNYFWEPASLIPDASGLTIKPSPNVTTTFSITVSQPGSPSTCPPRTASYLAYVEPYPVITLPFKEKTICYDDSFELTAYVQPEGINYSYEWTPPYNLRGKYAMPNKFFAPPGETYGLQLKAITPGAQCTSFDSLFIKVVEPFKFQSVSPEDTTIYYNDEIALNTESAAIMWYWFPVDYLDDPMLKSPKARPLKPMKYTVVGLDQYGCRDTAHVNIDLKYMPKLFIPNAFSPNGDGVNDKFGVLNIQFERFLLMRIFNRHGEMVFETTNPDHHWDGNYNGQPAPQDVYFYEIRLALPNGGEQYYRKGDVSLLR